VYECCSGRGLMRAAISQSWGGQAGSEVGGFPGKSRDSLVVLPHQRDMYRVGLDDFEYIRAHTKMFNTPSLRSPWQHVCHWHSLVSPRKTNSALLVVKGALSPIRVPHQTVNEECHARDCCKSFVAIRLDFAPDTVDVRPSTVRRFRCAASRDDSLRLSANVVIGAPYKSQDAWDGHLLHMEVDSGLHMSRNIISPSCSDLSCDYNRRAQS